VVLFWALPYMIHMGLLLLVDLCLPVGLMTFVNLPSIAEALDGRLNEVVIRYLHLNRSRFALAVVLPWTGCIAQRAGAQRRRTRRPGKITQAFIVTASAVLDVVCRSTTGRRTASRLLVRRHIIGLTPLA
jgi:hypothetical protein